MRGPAVPVALSRPVPVVRLGELRTLEGAALAANQAQESHPAVARKVTAGSGSPLDPRCRARFRYSSEIVPLD